MNIRYALTFTTVVISLCSSSALAEANLPFAPKVDWPFGEYRTCLGYTGKRTFKRPLTEYAVERLASVGQGADKQYVVGNWADAILNEQIIAAHEYTIEQCRLRKAGESFSTECPLGNLSRDEAIEIVGADKDVFWSNPSKDLQPLKSAQQERLEALRSVIEEACGP